MNDTASPGPEDPRESPQRKRAAARLRPAALLLTAVSLVNITTGAYLLIRAVLAKSQGPGGDFQQVWNEGDPFSKAMLKQLGYATQEEAFLAMVTGQMIYGALAAILSVLALAGARNMLAMRSYPLAMMSAVLTALPCLTPCCVLGQVAGVWAFIMLAQRDVRSEFD